MKIKGNHVFASSSIMYLLVHLKMCRAIRRVDDFTVREKKINFEVI